MKAENKLAYIRKAKMTVGLMASIWFVDAIHAESYYWDTDGTSAGFGAASGTWGVDAFWSTNSAGTSTSANTTMTTSDTINFGTSSAGLTAGTVYGPSTAQSLLGLTFGSASGAITLSGGTLNLAAGGTLTVNNTAAVISTVLQGNGGTLTKAGSGALTLSGANTYTGATTNNAGTLKIGNASALPSGTTLNVNNSSVLDLNGYDVTVATIGAGGANAIITNSAAGSGTNTLTVTSFPSITFAPLIADGASKKTALVMGGGQYVPWLGHANNTFSGGLTLLSTGPLTRLWVGTMATTLNPDGSIKSSNLGTGPVIIGSTTGNAQIGIPGGAKTIYNPLVFNAAGYADGGYAAFRADSMGNMLYGRLTANLASISFSSSGTGSVIAMGQVDGPKGLWLKRSNITVTLSNVTANANNYQGATLVEPTTTLALGRNEQIPNGAAAGNVTNNGMFKLNGFSETLNGLTGTGVVDGVSGTPILAVGDNHATFTFSGNIKNTAGQLTLTKIGSGELMLTGTNAYSGATVISNGTLKLGGYPVVVANNSFEAPVKGSGFYENTTPDSWTFSSRVGITAGNSTTYNPTGTEPDGNQAAFTKGASWLGQSNITFGASSTYRVSFSAVCRGSPYVTPLAVMLDSTVVGTVNPGYTAWSTYELSSYVTAGLHTLVFSNTVAGDSSVNIDQVLVSDVNPSGFYNIPYRSPVSIAAGAVLDLGGVSQPVASLSDALGGGCVTNSSFLPALLTLNADAGNTDFSGMLSGRIGLLKTGTGTQILSGTNAFSQGTIISNGTLLVNGSITGNVMVAGGILGGTGVVAGTVTNRATIAAAGTNVLGTLTVTNLVMAENATVAWDFNASTQDLIRVTGVLTLPTVATVRVSRVASGLQPNRVALFTFGSGPTSGKLDGWVITDARNGTYAEVRGNSVLLTYPTGTMIRVF